MCGCELRPIARDSEPAKPSSLKHVVSLSDHEVPECAKRELVEIWLASNGNEAKALLEGFRLGFNTGVAAQANAEISHAGPAA